MKDFIKRKLREGYNDVGVDYIKNKRPKLDIHSDKQKKDVGDYVLVSIPYSEEVRKRYQLLGEIKAFDKADGTEVGNVTFGYDYEGAPLKGAIDVRPDVRRKGIGSEMYKFVEELTGEKIHPSAGHSTDAEKFWNQPKRNFGPDYS